jgi:hypothetical protein
MKLPFLLSLCRHCKQAGDTRYLSQDVSFFHATHLTLPEPIHRFISTFATPSPTKRSPVPV